MNNVTTFIKNGMRTIRLNRPEKKNALTTTDYKQIGNILNEDAKSDDTAGSVITGTGDYFSSGNDLSIKTNQKDILVANFSEFVNAMINYPKIMIAVVNGPAVGIGTTLLGLCDVVYASDRAHFHVPFVQLGLNAEACSSYTLPRILGRSLATELIFFGRKMNVEEAYRHGFVSRIFPHEQLETILDEMQTYGKLPVDIVRINKKLIMDNLKQTLLECNKRECEATEFTTKSETFKSSIEKFTNRKCKK